MSKQSSVTSSPASVSSFGFSTPGKQTLVEWLENTSKMQFLHGSQHCGHNLMPMAATLLHAPSEAAFGACS